MPDGFRRSPLRTEAKVREIAVYPPGDAPPAPVAHQVGATIDADDPILRDVRRALDGEFGGVILEGPPGTSKSWYAQQIAEILADRDPSRIRMLQFHASYQYEDFVEGWVPDGASFTPKEKHLLLIAGDARGAPQDQLFVLVIDELSRSDPARVFGEALTYIEATKRGVKFHIASGREIDLPKNLVIIATMNSFDRGVEEVDAAFDRRMAKIEMLPDARVAEQFLTDAGMADELKSKVLDFFRGLQRLPERHARIGHTYFMGLRNEDDLDRRWRLQLVHVLRKAYRLNPEGFNRVEASWQRIFPPPSQDTADESETEADKPPGQQSDRPQAGGRPPTPNANDAADPGPGDHEPETRDGTRGE
jgi:5-methylcytosine-specific restriction protein B